MSEKGMGVIYKKDDDGDLIRNVNKQIRDKIIKEYYEPHHDSLNKQVELHLNSHGFTKIIDCHSYPDYPLKMDINQSLSRPDFNIGIDQFHTPSDWISHSKLFFESRNYSLGIDWPYSGTIVPMEYYKTEPNVRSIMLEVNRRLYLKPNSIEKNDKFMKTRKVVLDWLELINSL